MGKTKKTQNDVQKSINIVLENAHEVNRFEIAKRDFEVAYRTGDYGKQVLTLASMIAYSVLRTCADPRGHKAMLDGNVSNGGMNPVIMAMRRDLAGDLRRLEGIRRANTYNRLRQNKNGDWKTDGENSDEWDISMDAFLADTTISDGMDLVQSACVSLIEQAVEHGNDEKWLDQAYMVTVLAKKVYIDCDAKPIYEKKEITPIQMAYKDVRSHVDGNKAVKPTPTSRYTYMDDIVDGDNESINAVDCILYRSGKYADVGGINHDAYGKGAYMAGIWTWREIDKLCKTLELTKKQTLIVSLRLRGMEYSDIAKYLSVKDGTITQQVWRMQDRAIKHGLTPDKINHPVSIARGEFYNGTAGDKAREKTPKVIKPIKCPIEKPMAKEPKDKTSYAWYKWHFDNIWYDYINSLYKPKPMPKKPTPKKAQKAKK